MDNFIKEQQESSQHQLAIWSIPIIVLLGIFQPYILVIGISIFFLVTSFKLLKSMLFWILVLGGISALIPFLAPIIYIVMIIFFIIRIKYVINNWRPFLYGALFYGFLAIVVTISFNVYEGYGMSFFSTLIVGIVLAIITTVMLQVMLKNCYAYNYESYVALGIMGSAPLIIISFMLPFLKIHMGDAMMSGDTVVTHSGGSYGGDAPMAHAGGETIIPSQSNVHTGDTYVDPYIRTMPDGIEQNNLSYNGPDKIAPNPHTTEVDGYWRSTSTDAPSTSSTSSISGEKGATVPPSILPGTQKTQKED